MAWIHQVSGVSVQIDKLPARKNTYKSLHEVRSMVMTAYSHRLAGEVRAQLAESLGVSVQSLEALRVGCGADSDGRWYSSWPSKDADGNFIGISRRYRNGEKKTIYGTQPGVFYVPPERLARNPVLIVEGGSDAAAAATVGLWAVGRPSNTGGVSIIKSMRLGPMVVVGEMDEAPSKRGEPNKPWCPATCRGCSHCWPGLFGAQTTAKQLGCSYIMPPVGCKDLRDVLVQGRVREFLALIAGK